LTYSADAHVTKYLTGSPVDVQPALHGPAFHFQGGGTDVDAAFQWMFDQVRGCSDCDTKLDIVVLRASGDDGYNDYLFAMKGVNSVETLVITDRNDSKKEEVIRAIRNAEVVFFSGGDQCNYVRNFKGTAIEDAVASVVARGGGIGGTSAGLAIQGDYTYDSCGSSNSGTRSFEALANPYLKGISFTYDFFHWPNMQGTMTDQHVVERDRFGRTLTFLARQIRDGKAKSVWGLAVDRETSLAVDKNGLATVMGKGPAYFVLADHMPEKCEPSQPLTYSNYKIWRRDAGQTFDLKNRPSEGFYTRSIREGVIDADLYEEKPCDEFAPVSADDPAALKNQIDATMKQCPYDFSPFKYVAATKDQEYIKAKTATLRRFLNSATRLDRLLYFPLLWDLELQTGDPKEIHKQIVDDVKDLSANPAFRGEEASKALQRGRELLTRK